jgi:RNA polymerase sigma-70 factor, ECF subfamily
VSKKTNWEQLMAEAQKGNTVMYNQLLTEVSHYIKSYLKYKLRSENALPDILQEVLISLHNARHTYNLDLPFKPWLFKIVQSRLMDHFRKQKRTADASALFGDESLQLLTAEAEVSQIEIADFNKALSSLSPDQRDVLLAMKIEGKSIREIANERSMSESAVKVTAHRAYQSLFKELGLAL